MTAPFVGRDHARLLSTSNGVLIVLQGDTQPPIKPGTNGTDEIYGADTYDNDMFASLDGGYTWGQCSGAAIAWGGRQYPAAALDSQGYLYVGGGYNKFLSRTYFNDVYRSAISFNNVYQVAQACGQLSVPTTIGLVAWPGTVGLQTLLSNTSSYAHWTPRSYGQFGFIPGPLTYTAPPSLGGNVTSLTYGQTALVLFSGQNNQGALTNGNNINDVS